MLGPGVQELTALAQAPPGGGAVTRLHYLDSDVAVVKVALPATADQPALRQSRVYRQSESGWVRMAPSAAHWGALSQWETAHLLIRYYVHDEQAVAEVAVQLDARYAELHRLFLGQPPRHMLTVVVDPAQPPGQIAQRASWDDPLVVASPAVYLAPATISDGGLLAQALLLALLEDFSAQAITDHDLPGHWQPLLNGIRLWLLWEQELPLAAWREPVVQWVLGGGQAAGSAVITGAPDFTSELCAQHLLWLFSPLEVGIPIACWRQVTPHGDVVTWQYLYPGNVELHLPPMGAERGLVDSTRMPIESINLAATIALATVMEYAADTYGHERIHLLLTEAGRQEGWATLIPAVFGVSADEFEAGWRAYLAEHYRLLPEELPG
jgi:hypothetical protein